MSDWQAGWTDVAERIAHGKPIYVGTIPPALLAELCTACLNLLNNGTSEERQVAHGFYQWWQRASLTTDSPHRAPDISGGTRDKKLDIWLEVNTVLTSERVAGANFTFARINPGASLRDVRPFVAVVAERWQDRANRTSWERRLRRDMALAYTHPPEAPGRDIG